MADYITFYRITCRKIQTEVFEIYDADSEGDAQYILANYMAGNCPPGRPLNIVRTQLEDTDYEVTTRKQFAAIEPEVKK